MGAAIDARAIRAERLRRHLLTAPTSDPEAYFALFRLIQPVAPIAMTYPGNPPQLVHRAQFDASMAADRLRADRRLVKGRFRSGSVGYVLADDLELYATAFRKPLKSLNELQQSVRGAIAGAGLLTPRQIAEATGELNKTVMPALHRMQTAFLVYEDQPDNDWERGWYLFEDEWPDVDLGRRTQDEAVAEVIARFLKADVFATSEQIKDRSALSKRLVDRVMADMESAGRARAVEIPDMGVGWMLPGDVPEPTDGDSPSTFMLHKSDPLVQSRASELKRRYAGLEVLQYLLIDGEFQGAVLGHWRIGPHDVDDIVLELPAAERENRRDDILAAVAEVYLPPNHNILRYAGEDA
ncbi:hypothetical protein HN371_28130 [Candidatus Poribacteria bacterium]|nr:hypothetical protein [Candidatus Poribacteria bacterium]MBT5536883.1 hypothetical protein [Candidatus Poribacteria bacterium]MBT5711858.1 hypothetical protein [Candidatus Poribacteria bacterium]MBT7101064.1 hypothetical protein [Candidatus Poribacteria bacterium]MBT7809290.1 hypothetical protein [Candidatus Poribacteria bacterium]